MKIFLHPLALEESQQLLRRLLGLRDVRERGGFELTTKGSACVSWDDASFSKKLNRAPFGSKYLMRLFPATGIRPSFST